MYTIDNLLETDGVEITDLADVDGIVYVSATVTPEGADRLLDMNTKNRKVTGSNVAYLEAVIRQGNWTLTPDHIAIDPEGVIVNGAHRLTAISHVNQPIPVRIMLGVKHSTAFTATDRGRPRSFPDVLGILGATMVNQTASIVTRVVTWAGHGFYSSSANTGTVSTIDEKVRAWTNDIDLFHAAANVGDRLSKDFRGTGITTWGAMYYLIVRGLADGDGEEQWALFEDGLHQGYSKNDKTTIAKLVRGLKDDEGKPEVVRKITSPKPVLAGSLVRTWNSYLGGYAESATIPWKPTQAEKRVGLPRLVDRQLIIDRLELTPRHPVQTQEEAA